ncbi:MAG: diguanylate cyclase [Oscillospiraceae bacterium]|nr:diguanylate cyclase [Oscillospiraceae bacterium]
MKKILIVDDAQFMQKVTSGILSEKYETVCASSGPEAMELYEKENPDMILSDLIMPQMTGLELQRLLTEKYDEHIPFMFMTADEREENESLGLEAGAMDYIRKPFKPEVLLRRVDNIMRHVENLRQIQGLKVVAETDPMTGLLNKAFATKTLAELCPKANGILMMVDLDSFKLVNDIHGHGMGDRILIRFSEILRSVIRSSDVAGRMGGDEFIVFCRDIRDEQLIEEKSAAINSLLLASAKEFMGEDMNIPLGASIGAVLVPDEGTEFADLYKKADKALYTVKQNGKHGYAFFRAHDAASAAEAPKESAGSLDSARMILDERNRQKGSYELGFENFRSVYRFIVRSMENYHYDAEFVLFTFAADVPADTADSFGDLLRQSLRRSDVYTKSAKGQYMVLLPQPGADHGEAIVQRILTNWNSLAGGTPVACDHETVQSVEQ